MFFVLSLLALCISCCDAYKSPFLAPKSPHQRATEGVQKSTLILQTIALTSATLVAKPFASLAVQGAVRTTSLEETKEAAKSVFQALKKIDEMTGEQALLFILSSS